MPEVLDNPVMSREAIAKVITEELFGRLYSLSKRGSDAKKHKDKRSEHMG
jgi:hypothetical protein